VPSHTCIDQHNTSTTTTSKSTAERAAQVKRLLDAHEARERGTRQALARSLQVDWTQQAEAQKGRNKLDRAFLEHGMTPATCGLGALQRLEGEDAGCVERRREQARRQRAWVLEQLGEQETARRAAAAREAAEVAGMRHIQELMARHERAEAAFRRALTEAIRVENEEAAGRQRAAEEAREAARRAEERALVERLRQDPMLSEVNNHVCPETGRIQVDRFRGYTAAQRERMREENAALVQEKARRQAEERAADEAWARQQAAWGQRLEDLQAAEAAARRELELATRAALQQQQEEHRKQVENARADAFGRIVPGEGLHSKFGTSLA
jgi:hypothetical protein